MYACCSFYVPCVVMLGIYCRLYCYAQKHVKNIRAVTRPLAAQAAAGGGARVGVGGGPSLPLHLHAHSTPYHVSDHKAAITVGVIMGVFLVCWVPFFVINIVAAYCKDCIPGTAFKVRGVASTARGGSARGCARQTVSGTSQSLQSVLQIPRVASWLSSR